MILDFRTFGRLLRPPRYLTDTASTSGIRFPHSEHLLCRWMLVEIQHPGSGGGGAATTASQAAAGAGGAAGPLLVRLFEFPRNCRYFAGVAGAAGAAGSSGGNAIVAAFECDSVGPLVGGGVNNEGVGMAAGTATAYAIVTSHGSPPGPATSGLGFDAARADIGFTGEPGAPGHRFSGTVARSGRGGSSKFGAGGAGRITAGNGNDAVGYGGGGGGGLVLDGSAAATGGAGGPGLIVVWEFGE